MDIKNYLFLWFVTFSIVVVFKKTSFASHFIWPVMKLVRPKLDDYTSFDAFVSFMGVSGSWWRSTLGDLLACYICLSYWIGVVVMAIGAPPGAEWWMYPIIPLAWLGLTHLAWKD